MSRQQLQEDLAHAKQGGTLDDYARAKLALLDAPAEDGPTPALPTPPRPLDGAGIHLI